MSFEGELIQKAREIASQLQRHETHLQSEYDEAQKRLLEAKAKRDLARSASKRGFDFQAKIGNDYQCPDCWMRSGVHEALYPVPGRHPREDLFKCSNGHMHSVTY
jgi:hypothetical protein